MSHIRIEGIQVQNYRSFGQAVTVHFPNSDFKKPVAIVGYNNAGKTNFLNSILYGITEKYVTKDTFTINDFHKRKFSNIPKIVTKVSSSSEPKVEWGTANLTGYHFLEIKLDGHEIESTKISSYDDYNQSSRSSSAFGAAKYFKIFYINFHEIKKEISTKKTSWGNLSSFLAKHIRSIVDTDNIMVGKKDVFKGEVKSATDKVLADSKLNEFLGKIQINYSTNLRQNQCHIEFGLPDYEDIFLEMMFKVGLNGDMDNLVPIDHFGDGYISMFVMAVIQAIAESNGTDKCLFLFEEPESFLHENHQEYFYKTVLCGLAEKGHQVIYTTHSDKMLDIFDTRGLIRFEFDEITKQTVLKYNKHDKEIFEDSDEEALSEIKDYYNYIKLIDPNLNKIIFSKKVLLVEGPNDLMTYKEIIRRNVLDITADDKYAATYLNFNNISIIPHHGKITASILIKLCKHFGIDYFVINDFDFEQDFVSELTFTSIDELQKSHLYNDGLEEIIVFNSKGEAMNAKTKRSMITTNWRLISESSPAKIHFNIPKLESVIGYDSNDKSSVGIWNTLKKTSHFGEEIFPAKLQEFLEITQIKKKHEGQN
ncbi:Predicted ATP-dependent endonuclease of the OLD family, contains P-loop ATPase and TOPRIM domains [Paenibacillus algorifonticola]|uniref:Predicted ATP-dependent endonuclease of the OLD family, contains P-loop ATPase and TOPRIM domains n=1 Tax=Paenibacillus algorifonticola TaxID=684063 RepID=A0A1I1YYF3_9BACL|nr:AAA family ATPase [Paenibacillus algorifonticola]SFE24487.1 Predicted ATP-dependent endonuclease of the OLD family, contains P-loop ATPase and TOPRIM domains [Paenibacillus algorifonticola]